MTNFPPFVEQLADSLGMDLHTQITGGQCRVLGQETFAMHFSGVSFDLPVKIVASTSCSVRGTQRGVIIAILARVGQGDLHVLGIADYKKQVTMILIDGSTVPDIRESTDSFFDDVCYKISTGESTWSRHKIYRAILPGVLGAYVRDYDSSKWQSLGPEFVSTYVAERTKSAIKPGGKIKNAAHLE